MPQIKIFFFIISDFCLVYMCRLFKMNQLEEHTHDVITCDQSEINRNNDVIFLISIHLHKKPL